MAGVIDLKYSILSESKDQAGTASGDYFHQDLLVASFIHNAKPERHIDIGSRIDGFVAHVASFRKIEILDIRPFTIQGQPNISFLQADLMEPQAELIACTASLSCLHTLEHFGLGRYGDTLDPKGHITGFQNMLKILKPNGIFYISFPLAVRNEVHFNAHRKFHPLEIFKWVPENEKIQLERFDFVDRLGNLHRNVDIHNTPFDDMGCGIYSLRKS